MTLLQLCVRDEEPGNSCSCLNHSFCIPIQKCLIFKNRILAFSRIFLPSNTFWPFFSSNQSCKHRNSTKPLKPPHFDEFFMSFELASLASNNVTRHFGAFSNTMRIYVTEGKTIIKCASIQFKRLVAVREPAKPRFRLLSRRSPRSAQEKKCFSCLCAISEAIARCYSYSYRIIG